MCSCAALSQLDHTGSERLNVDLGPEVTVILLEVRSVDVMQHNALAYHVDL